VTIRRKPSCEQEHVLAVGGRYSRSRISHAKEDRRQVPTAGLVLRIPSGSNRCRTSCRAGLEIEVIGPDCSRVHTGGHRAHRVLESFTNVSTRMLGQLARAVASRWMSRICQRSMMAPIAQPDDAKDPEEQLHRQKINSRHCGGVGQGDAVSTPSRRVCPTGAVRVRRSWLAPSGWHVAGTVRKSWE